MPPRNERSIALVASRQLDDPGLTQAWSMAQPHITFAFSYSEFYP
jgi:hypothetical protein